MVLGVKDSLVVWSIDTAFFIICRNLLKVCYTKVYGNHISESRKMDWREKK